MSTPSTHSNWQETLHQWNPATQWLCVVNGNLDIKNKPKTILGRLWAWIRYNDLPQVLNFLTERIPQSSSKKLSIPEHLRDKFSNNLLELNEKIQKYNNHFFRLKKSELSTLSVGSIFDDEVFASQQSMRSSSLIDPKGSPSLSPNLPVSPNIASPTHSPGAALSRATSHSPSLEQPSYVSTMYEEKNDVIDPSYKEATIRELMLSSKKMTRKQAEKQIQTPNIPRVGKEVVSKQILKGLSLTTRSVVGDGHCLFRAFSAGLFHMYEHNPDALEQKIIAATQGMRINHEIQHSITACIQALRDKKPIETILGDTNFSSSLHRRTHGDNVILLLRQLAVRYMATGEHREEVEMAITADRLAASEDQPITQNDIQAYLQKMQAIGTYDPDRKIYSTAEYGGNLEMIALSEIFGVSVACIDLFQEENPTIQKYQSDQHCSVEQLYQELQQNQVQFCLILQGQHYQVAYL